MASRVRAWSAAVAATVLVGAVAASPASAQSNNNTVKKLTKAVTADGVLAHLEAFQGIADECGNRAAGQPGYEASVDYVVEQLEAAGYTPEVQAFDFDYFEENNVAAPELAEPDDVRRRDRLPAQHFDTGSPEGTATGPLVPVGLVLNPSLPANSNTSGCEAADFAGMPGRRHRARPARHVRLRRQGAQRPGRRRGRPSS